ncbi:MAG: hypothetical protein MPF33_09340 [Candidatus Aramenus sp.]|jgi:hypothetical protein|nr:hypothetical protein [Candidatus Aramenus sp.]
MKEAEAILTKLVKLGANSYILSKVTGLPSTRVRYVINNLMSLYGLSIATLISTESLGLRKAIVICSNSKLKMETRKRLLFPIAHLFRHDVERDYFFVVVYFVDDGLSRLREVLKELKNKGITECEAFEISRIKRFIVKPSCIDFETGNKICEDKIVITNDTNKRIPGVSKLTKTDIDFLATLQHNPFINYLLYPRWRFIKRLVSGFFFSLGNFSFIIDVLSDKELPLSFPNLAWSAETEKGYLTEVLADDDNLEKIVKMAKVYSSDILIVPATTSYAEGYSIPYEIFKGQWLFPKIIITNS